jgi:hypothetical protein
MFRSSADHHQGAFWSWLNHWLKYESSSVVMRQHTFIRFACCIVWRGMSTENSQLRRNRWSDYTPVRHVTEIWTSVYILKIPMYAVTSYRVTTKVSSRYCSNTIPSKISESEGVIPYNTIFGELTAIRFITEIKTLIWKGTAPGLRYARKLNISFGWWSVYRLLTEWQTTHISFDTRNQTLRWKGQFHLAIQIPTHHGIKTKKNKTREK